MNKVKIPNWFSATYKPKISDLDSYKPLEFRLIQDKVLRKFNPLYDGGIASFNKNEIEGENIYIKVETNYDDCYYEGDNPEIDISLITLTNEPNPFYARQLAEYNKKVATYEFQNKEWDKWKKIWDEKQEDKSKQEKLKVELREKRLLEKLKAKYEQNN